MISIGAAANPGAAFGQGSGPILLAEVACVGDEASLLDCGFITTHDCTHLQDAGISCNPTRKLSV